MNVHGRVGMFSYAHSSSVASYTTVKSTIQHRRQQGAQERKKRKRTKETTLIPHVVTAHHCVLRCTFIDETRGHKLARHERTKALEEEPTPLHPIIDSTWDDAGILWTDGAMPPSVSIVHQEMDKTRTYYAIVIKRPRSRVYITMLSLAVWVTTHGW